MTHSYLLTILFSLVIAGPLSAAASGSWNFLPSPQTPVGFQGDGTGTFPGATPVATWDPATGANIIWKTAMPGTSHASPIVVGDQVYLSSVGDGDKLIAMAINATLTCSPVESSMSISRAGGRSVISLARPINSSVVCPRAETTMMTFLPSRWA